MRIVDIKPGEFFRTSIGGMPSMMKFERVPDKINRWGYKINAKSETTGIHYLIEDEEQCVVYPPTAPLIPFQQG